MKLKFWRAPLTECRNGQYLVGLDLVVADEADDELVPEGARLAQRVAVAVVHHVEASVHIDAHGAAAAGTERYWGPRGGARAPWRTSTRPPMRQAASIWALHPVQCWRPPPWRQQAGGGGGIRDGRSGGVRYVFVIAL